MSDEVPVDIRRIEYHIPTGVDMMRHVQRAVAHALTISNDKTDVFLDNGDVSVLIYPDKGAQVAHDTLAYAQSAKEQARGPQHDYET